MMNPRQLLAANQLDEAIQALSLEVRNHPADTQRRTFLFELLSFAGEYDRAEKHLNVLAEGNSQSGLGAVLYLSALHGMRTRETLFREQNYPRTDTPDVPLKGTLNGTPFTSLTDADPRVGPRLEAFAAGSYLWIPFAHIESIEIQAPRRFRDLLWAAALVRTGPSFKDMELGEVLLPVLQVFSHQQKDGAVRLGKATIFEETPEGVVPFGQKMLLIDDQDVPLLEVRKLEFQHAAPAAVEQAAG